MCLVSLTASPHLRPWLAREPVQIILRAEVANERHGGVTPATLSSTIDSISQGMFDDLEDLTDGLVGLLQLRDLLPGDTEAAELLITAAS